MSAYCVLVFMARGVYAEWTFPVGYKLAHSSVNKNILNVGEYPKHKVCDQSTFDHSAFKLLKVIQENPFFFCQWQ